MVGENPSIVVQLIISGVLAGGVYALAASGLSIIYGVMKILNMAHGEMLLLGAYITWWLFPLNPILAIVVSPIVLAAMGGAVQKYLLPGKIDRSVTGPLVVTFGLSIILQNLLAYFFTANPRGITVSLSPVLFGPISLPTSRVIAFASALIILTVLHVLMTRTHFGLAIRACSESSMEAELTGINTRRATLISFALGSMLAGISGSLLMLVFSIDPFQGPSYLLVSFTVIVLAGFNLPGIILAAMFLSVAETVWSYFLPSVYANALGYALFLLVLVLRPSGLVGKGGIHR